MSHRKVLGFGLALLIAADAALAKSHHWTWVWAGISLWGLHLAVTQGLLATMLANTAPADLRGTAYGFFNLMSGIAMLIASALAGLLWDRFGAEFTFIAGGVFSTFALLTLIAGSKSGAPAQYDSREASASHSQARPAEKDDPGSH